MNDKWLTINFERYGRDKKERGGVGGVDIPEITGVYDPLSGLRDGTITSQAPIVVSGYNLNRYALENIRLCLVTHAKPEQVIDIRLVYRYSEGKVVVALPELKPGEYRPAVILKGDEKKVYVLPMRWVVRGRWRR